jgi:5-(carboxyamino)imidazole ribonucleotide synthase
VSFLNCKVNELARSEWVVISWKRSHSPPAITTSHPCSTIPAPYWQLAIFAVMLKVGILGGGQLGRMLLQAAANYPVETYVLENEEDCPAAHLCHLFSKGDIRDYEAVLAFGSGLDAITIEIENVNTDALEQLEKEGVKIYPKPSVLKTIKNKILQKEYYKNNGIPSADFIITKNKEEVFANESFLPAIHKLGEGGYDGRGVKVLQEKSDLDQAFDKDAVLEKKIKISKEIAMIVAINDQGDTAIYPPVEMMFDPVLNLLDFQLCPAELDQKTLWKAEAVALSVVRNFNSPGIFAIEMFIDEKNDVLVNETAPRVHNSGHHTIEAHYSSQFDMLWRVILGYPLGNTDPILPSIMINVIGSEGHMGEVRYEGLEDVLKIENAFVHLYGKKITKPGRKMGHVTILSKDRQELVHQSNKVRRLLLPKT